MLWIAFQPLFFLVQMQEDLQAAPVCGMGISEVSSSKYDCWLYQAQEALDDFVVFLANWYLGLGLGAIEGEIERVDVRWLEPKRTHCDLCLAAADELLNHHAELSASFLFSA